MKNKSKCFFPEISYNHQGVERQPFLVEREIFILWKFYIESKGISSIANFCSDLVSQFLNFFFNGCETIKAELYNLYVVKPKLQVVLRPWSQGILEVTVGEDDLFHVVAHVSPECVLQTFDVVIWEEDKRQTVGDGVISNVSHLMTRSTCSSSTFSYLLRLEEE